MNKRTRKKIYKTKTEQERINQLFESLNGKNKSIQLSQEIEKLETPISSREIKKLETPVCSREIEKLETPQSKSPIKKLYFDNFEYIIPAKNLKLRKSTLNQYICLACNNINLVEESNEKSNILYSEHNVECRVCKKVTPQIFIKDKLTAKVNLELANTRTPEEENAYRAIKKKPKVKVK